MADLLSACESGDIDSVRAAIDCGIDPNLQWDDPARRYRHGKSALMWPARFGHFEIAKFLILCGANIEFNHKFCGTALHYAAFHGQTAIGELLIASGAAIESLDSTQETPMHTAAANLKLEFVRMLIAAGANVNARDFVGITPLDCASLYADQRTFKLVRESGGIFGRFGDKSNDRRTAPE
jgi:ankyrin repeat protein